MIRIVRGPFLTTTLMLTVSYRGSQADGPAGSQRGGIVSH